MPEAESGWILGFRFLTAQESGGWRVGGEVDSLFIFMLRF